MGPVVAGERLEDVVPEGLDVRSEGLEAGWIGAVDVPGSLPPVADESGPLEDPQVLRDGGPAHRELGRQLAHRARSLAELVVDRPSGGVRQGEQGPIVSEHLR